MRYWTARLVDEKSIQALKNSILCDIGRLDSILDSYSIPEIDFIPQSLS